MSKNLVRHLLSAILIFYIFTPLILEAAGYKYQAKLYFSKKQYEKAKEYFLKNAEADPQDSETWLYLGYIAELDKDNDHAAECYKKSVKFKGLHRDLNKIALWKLIIYHKQKNELAQTYHYAKIFLSYFPRYPAVEKVIDQITAEKMWTLSADAEQSYLKGIEELQKGNSDSALAFFEKSISFDSQFVAPKAKIGIIYYGKGDLSYSARVFQDVLAQAPFYGLAHFYLGLINEKQNNCGTALDRFNSAKKYLIKEYDYTLFHIPYRMGRCYLKLNDPEKAISSFKKALERRPKSPKLHLLLGICYEKMDNLKDAEYFFQKAHQLAPSDEAYYRLYRLSFKKKKPKEQIHWAGKLYQLTMKKYEGKENKELKLTEVPERMLPAILVAIFHLKDLQSLGLSFFAELKNPRIPWNDETLKPFPQISMATVFFLIGEAYFKLSNQESALDNLRQSSLPEASYLAAKIYAHQKKWNESLENLEKSIQGDAKYTKISRQEPIFSPLSQDLKFQVITGQITSEDADRKLREKEKIEAEKLEKEKQEREKLEEEKRLREKQEKEALEKSKVPENEKKAENDQN